MSSTMTESRNVSYGTTRQCCGIPHSQPLLSFVFMADIVIKSHENPLSSRSPPTLRKGLTGFSSFFPQLRIAQGLFSLPRPGGRYGSRQEITVGHTRRYCVCSNSSFELAPLRNETTISPGIFRIRWRSVVGSELDDAVFYGTENRPFLDQDELLPQIDQLEIWPGRSSVVPVDMARAHAGTGSPCG